MSLIKIPQSRIDDLDSTLSLKQNVLTAGDNITIRELYGPTSQNATYTEGRWILTSASSGSISGSYWNCTVPSYIYTKLSHTDLLTSGYIIKIKVSDTTNWVTGNVPLAFGLPVDGDISNMTENEVGTFATASLISMVNPNQYYIALGYGAFSGGSVGWTNTNISYKYLTDIQLGETVDITLTVNKGSNIVFEITHSRLGTKSYTVNISSHTYATPTGYLLGTTSADISQDFSGYQLLSLDGTVCFDGSNLGTGTTISATDTTYSVATTSSLGLVQPDGTTITIDDNGVISSSVDLTDYAKTTDVNTALAAKADTATTLSGYGITDAYTISEIDSKLTSAMHYKGTVDTVAALDEISSSETGDVYNVTATGDNYAWDGTSWDKLSGVIDLSAYLTEVPAATTDTLGGIKVGTGADNTLTSSMTNDVLTIDPGIKLTATSSDSTQTCTGFAYLTNKPEIIETDGSVTEITYTPYLNVNSVSYKNGHLVSGQTTETPLGKWVQNRISGTAPISVENGVVSIDTSNLVDTTSIQTVAGQKTFTSAIVQSGAKNNYLGIYREATWTASDDTTQSVSDLIFSSVYDSDASTMNIRLGADGASNKSNVLIGGYLTQDVEVNSDNSFTYNGSQVLTASNAAASIGNASADAAGLVKVDGSTITATDGVISADLSNYVDLDSEQTITGTKTFNNATVIKCKSSQFISVASNAQFLFYDQSNTRIGYISSGSFFAGYQSGNWLIQANTVSGGIYGTEFTIGNGNYSETDVTLTGQVGYNSYQLLYATSSLYTVGSSSLPTEITGSTVTINGNTPIDAANVSTLEVSALETTSKTITGSINELNTSLGDISTALDAIVGESV